MTSVWLPVPGYEGLYEVSNCGLVRSVKRRKGTAGGNIKLSPDKRGYVKVVFYDKKRSAKWVHRLVLEAFIGPPPAGFICCHWNGNPSDNRLENLRWASASDNYADAVRHGTAAIGIKNPATKLTPCDRSKLFELRKNGVLQRDLASAFGISQQHVSAILRGASK